MTNTDFFDLIDYEDRVLVPLGIRPQPLPWRAVWKGIEGRRQLTDDELAIWLKLTGGVAPRAGGYKRVLIVAGRRSGKSSGSARLAWFEATQRDHYRYLEPGQIGSVSVVAQDLPGATQVVNYTQGLAEFASLKRKHVARIPVETVELKNGLRIEKVTATEQAVRSRTAVTVIADEFAYWDHTGPDEDRRVLDALTPSLLASSAAPPRRLIALTSAGYRRGKAFELYEACYGKPDAPWLVISGSTLDFRPDIDISEIDADCVGDPGKRAREYFSVWSDVAAQGFFASDTIAACVRPKIELAQYTEGVRYTVALDPAFRRDNFCFAVACSTNEVVPDDIHRTRRRVSSLVHIEAWKPDPKADVTISPDAAAYHAAKLCAKYNTRTVYSDQHNDIPMREALKRYGVKLVKRDWHSSTRSTDPKKKNPSKEERFNMVREAMHEGALVLPNDPGLIRELETIVHEPNRNGTLKIYGAGKNDDRAAAAVLALSEAIMGSPSVATKSLSEWEKIQRAENEARLAAACWGGSVFYYR